MADLTIRDLAAEEVTLIQQVAEILVAAFAPEHPEAWPDLQSALEEVRKSFAEDRISRVAIDETGAAVGWVGAIDTYEGEYAWELHPLAVRPDQQSRGVGAALVADLERQVLERGGGVVYLGSDDENNQTSLGGMEVFPGVLSRVAALGNVRGHAFEFYIKQGYEVVGIIPHANGFGRPDILMAKSLLTG